jgi:AraC-like DNA-binding protein
MGYLNDQTKNILGVSPSVFIKKATVAEAKRLIANTNLSMAEIALKLGFANGSYFCRLFKSEMGVTPTQFKRICMRKAKRE